MTTLIRSKENDCDCPLFKTPLRTPVRNNLLSNAKLNDLGFYSNNINHIKFVGSTNMNNIQRCSDSMTTPIRLNKTNFSTPGSLQRRRALGLVNSNSTQISHEDFSSFVSKPDESVILPAPASPNRNLEDDFPHQCQSYEDTFDDLIPMNERVERMINQINGVNIFTYSGGIENSIRCQSPQCSRVDMSILLDILN